MKSEEPRYKRERVAPLATFDRRSLRIVERGTHKLIVGCPRGAYDPETKHCQRSTVLQAILHPLAEPNPCALCQRARLGLRF